MLEVHFQNLCVRKQNFKEKSLIFINLTEKGVHNIQI